MQDAAENILEYSANSSSEEEFAHDKKTLDACLRNFQVLGDAAKLVPKKIREEMDDLPWRQITGMRDVLVHEYFGISTRILWNAVQKNIPSLAEMLQQINTTIEKPLHPWRICPPGEAYVRPSDVRKHIRRGSVVREHLRRDFCRHNKSTSKNVLTSSEMQDIAELVFPDNQQLPHDVAWEFGKKGDAYDSLIGGWTRYWNEVLHPDPSLDPDIIKALIASESSFRPDWGKRGKGAKGLMQLLSSTIKYLAPGSKEIRDNFIKMNAADVFDPAVNICAGIRWLFRKRETASSRLGRQATWEEAVEEYKDYLRRRLKNPKIQQRGMDDFRKYLKQLKTKDGNR